MAQLLEAVVINSLYRKYTLFATYCCAGAVLSSRSYYILTATIATNLRRYHYYHRQRRLASTPTTATSTTTTTAAAALPTVNALEVQLQIQNRTATIVGVLSIGVARQQVTHTIPVQVSQC